MSAAAQTFREQGVSVWPKLCTHIQAHAVYQEVGASIRQCACELNCTTEQYLRNVSRWVDPSPITRPIYRWAKAFFSDVLSEQFGKDIELMKMNIISKSAHARQSIPCHQDIAYSREHPYEFSLWFALQDVTLNDGVFECLPGSHTGVIAPAVDFWQPEFVDQMVLSDIWRNHFIRLPIQAGDAILFDSRIWHRSAISDSGCDRFAIVTRWRRADYRPPIDIPEKIPAYFGMWTCSRLTASLLQQGLTDIFHDFDKEAISDLATSIQIWQQKLRQHEKLPFTIDRAQAQQALNNLSILHQAAERHNGGDAQGIVYLNVWAHFLKPLSKWLNRSAHHEERNSNERAV